MGNLFSRFSEKLRARIPSIMSSQTAVLAPLANVVDERAHVIAVLEKQGFERMTPSEVKSFLDGVENPAAALDYSGRVWMKKGPLPFAQWMLMQAGLWNAPTENLYFNDVEANERTAHGIPIPAKKLRRSCFSNRTRLCHEGKYGVLLVMSEYDDPTGIIPKSGLKLELELHCNDDATRDFQMEGCRVEVLATLQSMKWRQDEGKIVHVELPSARCVLARKEMSNPPLFFGNVNLIPKDATSGSSKATCNAEFMLQVVCRFYESSPQGTRDTGCDLLAHIFDEAHFVCRT